MSNSEGKMSKNNVKQKASYLCGSCGQTVVIYLDREVHLSRQELKINGLASYIDIHPDKQGIKHGMKLFIDPNFHVRTNHKLEVKAEKKASIIPLPSFKTTNLSTKYPWKTWNRLELALKNETILFKLELDRDSSENTVKSRIRTESTLGLVECKVDAIVSDNATQSFEFIAAWIQSLCNSLERASSIHIDLVPEVLRYIDMNVYREITASDHDIIAILIDKPSILIPKKETFKMLQKYAPGLALIELTLSQFSKITKKLITYDRFTMRDVQTILEDEINTDAELEEEVIILALFYLLSMDAFEFHLSYLHRLT